MVQLTVRRLDARLLQALRVRAATNGRSTEAEIREILRAALEPERRSFKDHLRAMPCDGLDDEADFSRAADLPRDVEL